MRRGAGGPPRPAGTLPQNRRGAAPEKEIGFYDIIPFGMIVHICSPTRSFRSIPPFPAHPKVKQTGLPTAFFRSTEARRSRRRAGRCSYNVPCALSQARNRPGLQFGRQSRVDPAPIPRRSRRGRPAGDAGRRHGLAPAPPRPYLPRSRPRSRPQPPGQRHKGRRTGAGGAVAERCRSGRTGRSRKPLCALRTVGSNPTLSANTRSGVFPAISEKPQKTAIYSIF